MPSRRSQINMTDEEIEAYIDNGWTLQTATIGPSGYPHLVAMWYGVIDGKIHFTTYAKAQKVKNLERDPKITVMLESGTEYQELKGLVIEGEADVIQNDPDLVIAVQDATSRKSGNPRQPSGDLPMDDDQRRKQAAKRAVIRINPTKIISWDHSKLGGRY